jgi:hypothetical protein
MTILLIDDWAALASTLAASACAAAAGVFAVSGELAGGSGRIGSVISGSAIEGFLSAALRFLVRGGASRASVFSPADLAEVSDRGVAMGEASRMRGFAIDPAAWRSITIRSGSESRNVE